MAAHSFAISTSSSKVASLRAAVALLLLIACSASDPAAVIDSVQSSVAAVSSRELAGEATAFTALDTAAASPVSVSIVSPETLASGASDLAAVRGVGPAQATTPAAPSGKLTPSPFIQRQSAAASLARLESGASASSASTLLSASTERAGSSDSQLAGAARVSSLKVSKPTTAPPHRSGSSSGADSAVGSGSDDEDDYESGSGSNRTYACGCSELRKVSLMGQANYCLRKKAAIGDKCGNVNRAEEGECPRKGAMPCSNIGFVLTKDAQCLLDDVDKVYKCVMSAEDLEIKRNGGKRKKKASASTSNSTGEAGNISSSATALLHRASSPALHVVTLAASVALGVAALL